MTGKDGIGWVWRRAAVALAAAGLSIGAAGGVQAGPAPAADATALTVDAETKINGVEIACTGIGQTKKEARWDAYGVRVEFSDAQNTYLAGAAITLTDRAGRKMLDVSCDAPWILLRLPAGEYRVDARLLDSPAKPRSARFTPPAHGQTRVVLQFPDA